MYQRVANGVDNRPIELSRLTLDHKLNLLANSTRNVANQARKFFEQMRERQHARPHNFILELINYQPEMVGRLAQCTDDALLAVLLVQGSFELQQARPLGDKLANQRH